MEEQNLRLTTGSSPVYPRVTTGLSAVYPRFISGTRSALSSWLLTSGPTLFCLCKPFSCKACPGIIFQSDCFRCAEKQNGRLCPRRTTRPRPVLRGLPRPAPPRPAAQPCAAPPRPARGVCPGFEFPDMPCIIPGDASHEKSLQRQIGVGTWVSSQKQKKFLVPVINRG